MRPLPTALSCLLIAAACGVEPAGEPALASASISHPLTSVTLEQLVAQNLVDPEFSADGTRSAYLDANAVATLVSVDGDGLFVPGSQVVLGQSEPLAKTLNGPEFGSSARGEAIVWSAFDGAGVRQLFMRRDGQNTQVTSSAIDLAGNLPCFNTAAPTQKQIGTRVVARTRRWFWVDEENPAVLHDFPLADFGSSGPRWFLDEDRILTNAVDGQGVTQIALQDLDGRPPRLLTTDAEPKTDAFSFRAPEFGGRPTLMTTIGTRLVFYVEEGDGSWRRVVDLDRGTKLRSPEPFVYAGRSFVSVVRQVGFNRTIVELVGLDGSVRLASATSPMNRSDPETVVRGGALFVYYFTNSSLFVSRFGP